MSKRLIFTLVFTLIFLLSVGSIAALAPLSAAGESVEGADSIAQGYIIKDFYGRVAVFKNGEDEPVKITDTLTDSLPDYDKNQLSKGVPAEDEARLKRLLEDYCS